MRIYSRFAAAAEENYEWDAQDPPIHSWESELLYECGDSEAAARVAMALWWADAADVSPTHLEARVPAHNISFAYLATESAALPSLACSLRREA